MKFNIINIILRGFTLLSKFILVFLLAKHLKVEDLGEYNLIVSISTIAIYIIGYEMHINQLRLFLKFKNIKLINKLIINQLYIHLFFYSIVSILVYYYFCIIKNYPYPLIFLIIILILCEAFSQELTRILVAYYNPLFANLVTFIRSGLWAIILSLLLIVSQLSLNLNGVLYFWIISSLLSCVIGYLYLTRSIIKIKWEKPSLFLIKYNLKKNIIFFFSTIFTVLVTYGDRVILDYYHGSSQVGIYSFFTNITSAISTFIYAGSISIYLPYVIKLYQNRQYDGYKKQLLKMQFNSISIFFIFSIIVFILLRPILYFLDKVTFSNESSIIFYLLLSLLINIITQYFHYQLYAQEADKKILIIHLISLLLFLGVSFIFVPLYGIKGTVFSNIFYTVVVFILKIYYVNKENIR